MSSKASKTLIFIGCLAVFTGLAGVIALWKAHTQTLDKEEASRLAASKAAHRVQAVRAQVGSTYRPISLVGDARPFTQVVLYSKISGFLKTIHVDKGDQVTKGQLLAVIESPELDRQYDAAVADAKDKLQDAQRARTLYQTGAMSLQDAQRIEAAAKVAENTAESLKAQKDYEKIIAPFSGVVTARYADPGALIQSATSTQTTALPIISLAQVDKLRVYAYADQSVAGMVKEGDKAYVADPAWPDAKIEGAVTRISGELDSKTRTLLVEIDVDNQSNKILAGSAVKVTLFIKTPEAVQVPASALITKDDKHYVGVITSDNRFRLRPVTLSYSDGKILSLSSGVKPGELIAVNVRNTLADGDKVEPMEDGA